MHAIIKSAFVATTILFAIPQAAAAPPATAPSALNGTWKLDSAGSRFASGIIIKSETRTYEVKGSKVKMTAGGTDAAGKAIKSSYSAAYDGKYYPMMGSPVGDSIALKRIDARHVEATIRKGKAVSAYAKATVSADGRHLALTRKMLRGKAAPVVDELSYVKQP